MDKNPTVSVIIPTYNRAHLIGRAIQSVLNQTYQDFEIIIIDDGSTDNTEDIVKEFQKKDKRIKYIRHEKNRGGSAARNTGIKAAKGEYIAFLDSDDEWLPIKLGRQISEFTNKSKIALVYTGRIIIEEGDRREQSKRYVISCRFGSVYKQLLEGDFIGTCSSVMVRADIFKQVEGFDEKLPSRQDWDLWLRIAKDHSISCVPLYLIIYYIGFNQISARLKRILEGTKIVIDKHREEIIKIPRLYSKHLNTLATIELNYNRKNGWLIGYQALKKYPFQPKLVIALLLSLFGKNIYRKVFFKWKQIRRDFYIGKASL